MRLKLRTTFAAFAAAAMVVTTAGMAAADSMSVGPDATVAAGNPGSFVVGLANDDNATDPVNGCNANSNSPVAVTFSTTNAAVVAAPTSVQVNGCDDPDTIAVENGVTVNYLVASGAVAGATATITGTASGGRTIETGSGKDKVTVNGIFTSDSITVTVATPAQTDSTPPVIVPTVIGTLGDNGWYTSNVTVSWTVTDGQSSITSSSGCGSTTISSDTSGTTLTCAATSAGGSASESVTIKRDETPPVVQCATAPSAWSASDISVSCSASDAKSDLAVSGDSSFSLSTSVDAGTETSTASTGSKTVYDQAGNSSTAGPITGLRVDKKAPTVSCDTADGVWHAADVSIACTATDGGSGLAGAGDASFTVATAVAAGTETANALTGTRTVLDAVGNSATAGPVGGNMVDKKGPTIAVTTPAAAAEYVLGQSVASAFNCSDAGSAVATCVGPNTVDTSSVGSRGFQVNATDNVGNTSSLTVNYSVGYAACGDAGTLAVRQPINANSSSSFKKGSTVPVKFQVCDANGNPVGPNSGSLGAASTADTSIAGPPKIIRQSAGALTVNETPLSTTPDTAFRWDSVSQQWIFNQSTKTLTAGTTYTFEITLNSGQKIEYEYGVK